RAIIRRFAGGGGLMQRRIVLIQCCVVAWFVSLGTVTTPAEQAVARRADPAEKHKRPIAHDVYDSWKSIQGTKLSRDGVWLAYALTPQDGDGQLVVRNLKTNAEHRARRGRDATITSDGKFVVFSIAPLKADVDKARHA